MGELIGFRGPQERGHSAQGGLVLQPRIDSRVRDVRREGLVLDLAKYREDKATKYQEMKSGLSWQSRTKEYVNFFNSFYREEGLPQDWQKLQYGDNQVGFSVNSQMDLLKGDDPESRRIWAGQTNLDMHGFIGEYLSPYNVYPWHHEKTENPDGSFNLADPRYGKKMVDTVTSDERNGSVREVLEQIDEAVISGKISDGSILVQMSPMDESSTGLVQDNGKPIVYTDTHLIISKVNGGKLDGFTIKTDFSKAESRELIRRLTGRTLAENAPIEDYIRSVALINPGTSNLQSIDDVVAEAARVRSDLSLGSDKVFKDRTWNSVLEQIVQGDRLYDFTDRMQAIVESFEEDVIRDNPSTEKLRDYIAATILRVSQEALKLKHKSNHGKTEEGVRSVGATSYNHASDFRDTLIFASAIQGCAGGGKTAVRGAFGVNRAVDRLPLGSSSIACNEIACGGCSWKANEHEAKEVQKGNLRNCPSCGWSPKKAA